MMLPRQRVLSLLRKVLTYCLCSGIDKVCLKPPGGKGLPMMYSQGCSEAGQKSREGCRVPQFWPLMQFQGPGTRMGLTTSREGIGLKDPQSGKFTQSSP